MKKKAYNTPEMTVMMLKQQQALLIGSYDGPANAPEIELGIGEMNIMDAGEVTFSDDVTVNFSD